MIASSEYIERIRGHHRPWTKGGGDVRVIRGGLTPKDVQVRDRDILVVANTAAIDCDDEVVVPEGADLSYIEKNRKIFLDHRYDYDNLIGGIRSGYPTLRDGRWLVRLGVSRCDLGDRVLRDAEDFGLGVSIGFDALDVSEPDDAELEKYGRGQKFRSIVRAWRWIELSITAMPCNVECQSVTAAEPKARKLFTLTPGAVVCGGVRRPLVSLRG